MSGNTSGLLNFIDDMSGVASDMRAVAEIMLLVLETTNEDEKRREQMLHYVHSRIEQHAGELRDRSTAYWEKNRPQPAA